MARKIDIVFNSEKDNDRGYFQIASGHISETNILFEKEDTVAVVYAEGRVEFYSLKDELLAAGKVPAVVSGKEVYEEIACQVNGSVITIQFPIYQWIDNYPHCDGEHDRWDTKKIGSHTLTFDRVANSVICK